MRRKRSNWQIYLSTPERSDSPGTKVGEENFHRRSEGCHYERRRWWCWSIRERPGRRNWLRRGCETTSAARSSAQKLSAPARFSNSFRWKTVRHYCCRLRSITRLPVKRFRRTASSRPLRSARRTKMSLIRTPKISWKFSPRRRSDLQQQEDRQLKKAIEILQGSPAAAKTAADPRRHKPRCSHATGACTAQRRLEVLRFSDRASRRIFQINPSEKIGLIGANGAGKTTLLKIIGRVGEVDPGLRQPEIQPPNRNPGSDSRFSRRNLRTRRRPSVVRVSPRSADAEMRELEHAIASATGRDVLDRYPRCSTNSNSKAVTATAPAPKPRSWASDFRRTR